MKKLIGCTLAVVFTILLVSQVCLGAPAPVNPYAQVKADAKLSTSKQKETAAQTRLQNWFMAKVRYYQHCLDDTAISKSSPRVVDLGDWSAFFKARLAPPTGTGTCTITFGEVGAASTMEDTQEIIFPQGSSDSFIDGSPDSCFHEFQHVIVLQSEKNGKPVAVPRSPWMIYAKAGDANNEEHIYMEGLAEFTVEWLDLLLHERSALTGGAAMGFEKHARAAHEQMKQYAVRGESLSYAVENFCWAKAHDAYCRAWGSRGHLIAPLPLVYRQDYEAICGVHIGFVEDVVKYYMGGGLKAADGKPIKVPEWVMNPDPMKSGVIVGHLNENKSINADKLRYGFDVRVMESYRIKERSDSLNNGKVTITLENGDANASMELAVDGKPIKRSGASGKIDLAGFKRLGTIRVTFVHSNLKAFKGVKRYRISVAYEPDSRQVDGKTLPPFYHSSKAIYYVDVTGTGPAAGAAATAATPGKSTASTSAAKGVWKLDKVTNAKKFDDMFANQNMTADASLDTTKIEINGSQQLSGPTRTVSWHSVHQWNHPGTTLTPGTKVPMNITITQDGEKGSPSIFLEAWLLTVGGMDVGLWFNPTFQGRDSNGGGISLDKTKSSGSHTKELPIPDGKPGETLHVRLSALSIPMSAKVEYVYVWSTGPASAPPADKPDAVLQAEETKPPADPPGLDNVPPEPGELVEIPKTDEKTPPNKTTKPTSNEQWYVHPSGDYKFKVSPGWKVFAKQFFGDKDNGYDTLFPADEGMAVICAQDYTDNGGKSADSVLKAFSDKMLKKYPQAQSTRVKFGTAEAVQIGDWDKDSGVMTWNIGVYHKGRSYFISVAMPSSSKPSKLPDAPAWMLGSLVTLR